MQKAVKVIPHLLKILNRFFPMKEIKSLNITSQKS
jgi:hypothetical protein